MPGPLLTLPHQSNVGQGWSLLPGQVIILHLGVDTGHVSQGVGLLAGRLGHIEGAGLVRAGVVAEAIEQIPVLRTNN